MKHIGTSTVKEHLHLSNTTVSTIYQLNAVFQDHPSASMVKQWFHATLSSWKGRCAHRQYRCRTGSQSSAAPASPGHRRTSRRPSPCAAPRSRLASCRGDAHVATKASMAFRSTTEAQTCRPSLSAKSLSDWNPELSCASVSGALNKFSIPVAMRCTPLHVATQRTSANHASMASSPTAPKPLVMHKQMAVIWTPYHCLQTSAAFPACFRAMSPLALNCARL